MNDTTKAIQERFEKQLMELAPAERLAMACRMFSTARALVLAGMPRETEASPAEEREYLFLRFYGRDFDDEQQAKIIAHLRAS